MPKIRFRRTFSIEHEEELASYLGLTAEEAVKYELDIPLHEAILHLATEDASDIDYTVQVSIVE